MATVIEEHGANVVVARTTMTTTAHTDHLTPWLEEALAAAPPTDGTEMVVVGHSAACPRIPYLAEKLLEAGHQVVSIVCVDGRFPDGTPFTESRSSFGEMLDSIIRPDDYLPPWPRWWGSLVEGLVIDPVARKTVFAEAKPIPRGWFDQPCPAPDLPDTVGRGFLCFGAGYRDACDRAHGEGWSTCRLHGDHLHQVVAPEVVATTLMAMTSSMSGSG